MAEISAAMVKKLRDETGAGMMECKAALTESNGNFEEARTLLRKRGLASAAKRAGRATAQGVWEWKLSKPVAELKRGKLTVVVRDRQGNETRIERTFGVGK